MGFIFTAQDKTAECQLLLLKLYTFFQNFESTYTKIANLHDLVGKDQHILSKKIQHLYYCNF